MRIVLPLQKEKGHRCNGGVDPICALYGPAFTEVFEDENSVLWALGDDFASVVNFCPFCGFQAPTQVPMLRYIYTVEPERTRQFFSCLEESQVTAQTMKEE